MTSTKEIAKVEIAVRMLRREFEKYFSGANDLPPHELEARVSRQIARLRSSARGAADLFRVNALEASFSSYRELYRRKLRLAEEGQIQRTAKSPAQPTAPDVRAGVHIRADLDQGGSEQEVMSLYRGLYGTASAPAVGLDQFRKYLSRQASEIRARTGCDAIVFRLTEDESGKQRLKAKPVANRKPTQ